MEIKALQVINFKRSKDIEIATPAITIVIGGNNSGKSSLLQGIHFAITVLQSARLSADGGKAISTLGFDQFIYKPTGDLTGLNHGSPLTSKKGPDFVFTYKDAGDDELKKFGLTLRRGKNANISVTCDEKSTFFTRAADRARPFSVFVPGLAGVPLREELRTPSVVANGIAQGDSNVYLRNVLYRILNDAEKLTRFHEVIGSIFEGLKISSTFNPDIHLFIDIAVELDGTRVPLEMVGTGCLQAIQLVAYVTAYDPSLLLLDEPDAHLHPSNQRLLAATLLRISSTGKTKIILASHSRHIFDALAHNEESQVVWLRHGVKQPEGERTGLSVLLDLGALDSFELFKADKQKIVFLTEDTKVARLKILLQANGLAEGDYFIQPLHGVNNLTAAVPIADFFIKQATNTWVIIHRDGDCMTDKEKEWWVENESKKLPERTFLFVTPLTDVEHSFCQPRHVAKVYGMTEEAANQKLQDILTENAAKLTVEYTQKRTHLKDNALRKMQNVPSAGDLIGKAICFNQVKGKSLLPLLLDSLSADNHNPMRLTTVPSPILVDVGLAALVQRAKLPGDAQTVLP
ncbi:MAG: AAA family ATPase [Massilia sp.]